MGRCVSAILNNKVINEYERRWTGKTEAGETERLSDTVMLGCVQNEILAYCTLNSKHCILFKKQKNTYFVTIINISQSDQKMYLLKADKNDSKYSLHIVCPHYILSSSYGKSTHAEKLHTHHNMHTVYCRNCISSMVVCYSEHSQ